MSEATTTDPTPADEPSARPRPAGLLLGAIRVADLAVRSQTLDRRSALPLALLALLPGAAALDQPVVPPGLGAVPPAVAVFHAQYAEPFLGVIALLVTLLLATAALGDELERKTLVHLMIRPVPRGAVYLGKLGWIIGAAWSGVALSAALTLFVLTTRVGGDFGVDYLTQLLLMQLLCVAIYGALFFALSLLLPFPTIAGLAYGFGLEALVGQLPGYLAWLSVRYHVQELLERRVIALYPGLAPEETATGPLSMVMQAIGATPPTDRESLALLGAMFAFTVALGWTLMLVREFTARMGKPE